MMSFLVRVPKNYSHAKIIAKMKAETIKITMHSFQLQTTLHPLQISLIQFL